MLPALLPDLLCRHTCRDTPLLSRVAVGYFVKEGHDGAWRLEFLVYRDVGVQYSWLFLQLEGPLAQLVEHRTFNPWVVGSIPTGPTLQDRPETLSLRPVFCSCVHGSPALVRIPRRSTVCWADKGQGECVEGQSSVRSATMAAWGRASGSTRECVLTTVKPAF